MQHESKAEKSNTRVFVSYSRNDAGSMAEVSRHLQDAGMLVDFDQSDLDPNKIEVGIAAEDEWWVRIQELITIADVIVFMVSSQSAKSQICSMELKFAKEMGKRIIPVLVGQVDFEHTPTEISALNVAIDFTESGPGKATATVELIAAINTNVGWLRRGRRLFDRIAEWQQRGAPAGLLVTKSEIEDADLWVAQKPIHEPELGPRLHGFLDESRTLVVKEEKRRIRLRRLALGSAVLVLLISAFAAAMQLTDQRRSELRISQSLTLASISAFDAGDYAQATRLSLIASTDSFLSPSAQGAQFQLGRSVMRMDRVAELPGELSSSRSLATAGGLARLVSISDSGLTHWSADEYGEWTSVELSGLDGYISHAELDRSGNTVLAHAYEGQLIIWSRELNGSWSKFTDNRLAGGIEAAMLAEGGDAFVAHYTDDRTEYWRRQNGGWQFNQVLEFDQPYYRFSISADGAMFAGSNGTGLDLKRRQPDGTWTVRSLTVPDDNLTAIEFDRQGEFLVAAFGSGHVSILSMEEDTPEVEFAQARHPKTPTELAISSNGRRFVSGDTAGVILVWTLDEETATWRTDVLSGHGSRIARMALSPSGDRLVTLTKSGVGSSTAPVAIRVWKEDYPGSWDLERTWRADPPSYDYGLGFASGEDTVIGSLSPNSMGVFKYDRFGTDPVKPLLGHDGPVYAGTFAGSNDQIVTGGLDGDLRVWTNHLRDGWSSDTCPAHTNTISAVASTPDGALLVSGSMDGSVKVWTQSSTGRWQANRLEGNLFFEVEDVAISPDGNLIVASDKGPSPQVWTRANDGSWPRGKAQQVLLGHTSRVRSVTFSPDGSEIATASNDGTVRVWRMTRDDRWSSQVLDAFRPNGLDIIKATYTPDGEQLVTTSVFSDTRVWKRAASGAWTKVETSWAPRNIRAIAFSRDGQLFATTSTDNKIVVYSRLWTGGFLVHDLTGHTDAAQSVEFSYVDNRILTTSSDGTPRVWDTRLLLNDYSRRKRRQVEQQSFIVQDVCERMLSFQSEENQSQAAGRDSYLILRSEDFDLAPQMYQLGLRPGDSVCSHATVSGFDQRLSNVLPRWLWSQLGRGVSTSQF